MTSQPSSTKYVIEARIEVDGLVDKNDVVGAIFGQTEGIFSSDLDLRELQRTGRIGRIEVQVHAQGDRVVGKISIPTSMDRFQTARVAAMVESFDKVGPYSARVVIEKIEDVRAEKRKRIIERARAILLEWEKKRVPEVDEALKELEESVVRARVVNVGPDNLPAGPDALSSEEVILVEGRADVINLLRYGYTNVIGIEGVKIPYSLEELLARKKKVIAFLDGDRGGDMILRELARRVRIDLVARAPHGREVEELSMKEVAEALASAVPLQEALKRIGAHVEREQPPVEEGSVSRDPESLVVRFTVTDEFQTFPVAFYGILPDLFREGQSVVATGRLQDGVFHADEVLAKHDENYMPKEVAEAIARAKQAKGQAPEARAGY
ncbi:MAG: DNA primase DnaG [Nitrososphaerota archaeon]